MALLSQSGALIRTALAALTGENRLPSSAIDGLGSAAVESAGAFAPASHTHSIAQVDGLQDALDAGAGADGRSAYEVALDNGFVGTEAEWLASLVGPGGDAGADGADGTSVVITVAADQAAFEAATPAANELVVLYA